MAHQNCAFGDENDECVNYDSSFVNECSNNDSGIFDESGFAPEDGQSHQSDSTDDNRVADSHYNKSKRTLFDKEETGMSIVVIIGMIQVYYRE